VSGWPPLSDVGAWEVVGPGIEYDPAAQRQAVVDMTKDLVREMVTPALRDALRRRSGRLD
jgi:hypothetical protein